MMMTLAQKRNESFELFVAKELPLSDDRTSKLLLCIEHLKSDDPKIQLPARDELINEAYDRLRRHTCLILNQQFPNQHGRTDEIHQGAMIRLWKALDSFRPVNVGAFFDLAARHIRYELLDQIRGNQRTTAHGGQNGRASADSSVAPQEPAGSSVNPSDLLAWAEFHEHVDQLPPELCEVTNLLFYWDLTQAEAAQMLSVPETTIQSRWRAARVKLALAMKRTLPGVDSVLLAS